VTQEREPTTPSNEPPRAALLALYAVLVLVLIAVLVILAIAVALGLLFLVRWRRKKAAGQTVPTPVEGIAQRPQEPPLPPASGGLPPPPPP